MYWTNFNETLTTGLNSDLISRLPTVTFLLTGDSFHQHCREFGDRSRCQIRLSFDPCNSIYNLWNMTWHMLQFLLSSQSLTSAWPVYWFVTKKPIISLSVSPGLPNPTAISAEVLRTSCVSLHFCAAQSSLFFAGRAGRVSKGYCYRLISKTFWNNEIQDHMIPEMLVNYLIFLLKGFIFFFMWLFGVIYGKFWWWFKNDPERFWCLDIIR